MIDAGNDKGLLDWKRSIIDLVDRVRIKSTDQVQIWYSSFYWPKRLIVFQAQHENSQAYPMFNFDEDGFYSYMSQYDAKYIAFKIANVLLATSDHFQVTVAQILSRDMYGITRDYDKKFNFESKIFGQSAIDHAKPYGVDF
jgi:hypothetical protein